MTRGGYWAGVTCAVAVLLASPAMAADKVCGEPLKGRSSGTIVTDPTNFPTLRILFTGPAHLSGLGLSEVVFLHYLVIGTWQVTGNLAFTAANGDELYASVTGTATPIPGQPNWMALDQVGTIVGGTGRFADGEGTFTIVGTKAPDNVVTVVMDGYIVRNRDCD